MDVEFLQTFGTLHAFKPFPREVKDQIKIPSLPPPGPTYCSWSCSGVQKVFLFFLGEAAVT